MSIHAKISESAELKLRAQKRKSTISSIVISVLVVFLIIIVLGIFLLPNISHESPVIVTYAGSPDEEQEIREKKVQKQMPQKPSAPSSVMSKVIATTVPTEISIPVPEVEVTTPSVDFGDGNDFGSGWDGVGNSGAGGGGGFGSNNANSGGLQGYFYALEHARSSTKSRPKLKGNGATEFSKVTSRINTARLTSSMFDDYFRADKNLYLTNLAIPNTPAEKGPELFGAGHIKGRYWMAHYSGIVRVPKSGTYRFSGVGDNFLHVQIDGKPVMAYGSLPPGWNSQVSDTGNFQSPYTKGWWVRNGKWFPLNAGQTVKIDIAIGETSGGMSGYMLQLEEKGTKYRKASDGRPILPLFTTAPFSLGEIRTLRDTFRPYVFDFDNVLVFPVVR